MFFKVLLVGVIAFIPHGKSMEESQEFSRKRKNWQSLPSPRIVKKRKEETAKRGMGGDQSSLPRLPNEILESILSHVKDRETLGVCRLTNNFFFTETKKSWETEKFLFKKRFMALEDPVLFQQEEGKDLIKEALTMGEAVMKLIKRKLYREAFYQSVKGMRLPHPLERESWVFFPVMAGVSLWKIVSRKDPSFLEGHYMVDSQDTSSSFYYKNEPSLFLKKALDCLKHYKENPCQQSFGFFSQSYERFIESLNLGQSFPPSFLYPQESKNDFSQGSFIYSSKKKKVKDIYHYEICPSLLSILSAWNEELKIKKGEENNRPLYEDTLKEKLGFKLEKLFCLENESLKALRECYQVCGEGIPLPVSLDYFESSKKEFFKKENKVLKIVSQKNFLKRKSLLKIIKNLGIVSNSFSLLKGVQKKNDPKVLYQLGLCYLGGYGVEKDSEKAMEILKESENLGCRKALFSQGLFTCLGLGGDRSLQEGLLNLMNFVLLYQKKPSSDFRNKNNFYYKQIQDVLNSLKERGILESPAHSVESVLINNLEITCQNNYGEV